MKHSHLDPICVHLIDISNEIHKNKQEISILSKFTLIPSSLALFPQECVVYRQSSNQILDQMLHLDIENTLESERKYT